MLTLTGGQSEKTSCVCVLGGVKVEKDRRVERLLEEPVHGSVPMIDLLAFVFLSVSLSLYRFEKYNKDGETLYATVGYMTVYNYYVYPDKTRPRVR